MLILLLFIYFQAQLAAKKKEEAACSTACPAAEQPDQRVKCGKAIPCFGVKRYRRTRPTCEDDASIAHHILLMKKESKKRNVDHRLVASSMLQTFADRRDYIIDRCPTLPELKAEYPRLFDAHEVCSYFLCLFFNIYFISRLAMKQDVCFIFFFFLLWFYGSAALLYQLLV